MRFYELTALQLLDLYKKREAKPSEVIESIFERIYEDDRGLKCYLTLTPERAFADAKILDLKLKNSYEFGVLFGIPTAVKDLISTRGIRTTCASKILENYVPVFDATVVKKLVESDFLMVGKTNMDEFAMGSSNENSAYGPVKNPWDITRVPGGSSGGSAAAVAAGHATVALGSDTGGSIRQPASFCGIVGLKPTYGLVSRYGLVAFASSLDQIGPMTRTVEDCALLLSVISGHDLLDSTSIKRESVDYLGSLRRDVKGIKVGVPKELSGEGIDGQVLAVFRAALARMEKIGVKVEETSLPNIKYALPAYYLIAPAEASSNLARYDGVKYGFRDDGASGIREMYRRTRAKGFGREVKRRIMLGTYALSAGYYDAYYGQAQKVRTLIIKDFSDAFSKYDLLVSPTSPSTAFKLGEKVDDPLNMYLSDICTIPVNLAGLPALSLPCGQSDGMPVGFQIIGPHFSEERILNAAFALEKELGLNWTVK
jgi:aspartyl-tRNA(Asn)/glutamyl-tRNA(Gln) amidotransferase subunit A